MRQLAVPVLLLLTPASSSSQAQLIFDTPKISSVWTDAEKTEFKNCVSRIADPSRENTVQLTADVRACVLFEERQHWFNLHPKYARRQEDSVKMRKCVEKHPAPKDGSPEELDAAFDFCMCKAYGLHTAKK